jgi:hypothetical protein
MDNQHRKIAGYRELSQDDIDLMNKIKEFGPRLEALCAEVRQRVLAQRQLAGQLPSEGQRQVETSRLDRAEAERWAAMAKTDFQTALMKLTRAVAQPTFF